MYAAFASLQGAMTLGGQVTRTIAGGIARPQTFAQFPALFMFGMLTAETAAMICEWRMALHKAFSCCARQPQCLGQLPDQSATAAPTYAISSGLLQAL
jgi:hypothetical protein